MVYLQGLVYFVVYGIHHVVAGGFNFMSLLLIRNLTAYTTVFIVYLTNMGLKIVIIVEALLIV